MKHEQLELPNSTISYIKYLTEEIHRVVNVQCGAITHTYKHAHEERERERERYLKAYSFPSKLQRAFRRCRRR